MLAAQTAFSCVEAAASHCGEPEEPPAHDAYTRLLLRRPPDTEALWEETQLFVHRRTGLLVLDDTTLDKPHAHLMALVHKHWSGKHHQSVLGINLVILLWTDGGTKLPLDCRLSNVPVDGVDKNQHFRAMLEQAQLRGFAPRYVCFDSWYSGLDNLKAICAQGWHWLTRFKSNRAKGLTGLGAGLSGAGLAAHEPTPTLVAATGTPDPAKLWYAPVMPSYNPADFWRTHVCDWGLVNKGKHSLCFVLYSNKQSRRRSALGIKWTHSYNLFLTGSNPVLFVDGEGTETPYVLRNAAPPPVRCYDMLVQHANSTWTLTKQSGIQYNFTRTGVLTSIVNLDGYTTHLTYMEGRLTRVTDAADNPLTLGYDAGQLVSVTDRQGSIWLLSYIGTQLVCLTHPPRYGGYSQLQETFNYDNDNNVTSLTHTKLATRQAFT